MSLTCRSVRTATPINERMHWIRLLSTTPALHMLASISQIGESTDRRRRRQASLVPEHCKAAGLWRAQNPAPSRRCISKVEAPSTAQVRTPEVADHAGAELILNLRLRSRSTMDAHLLDLLWRAVEIAKRLWRGSLRLWRDAPIHQSRHLTKRPLAKTTRNEPVDRKEERQDCASRRRWGSA